MRRRTRDQESEETASTLPLLIVSPPSHSVATKAPPTFDQPNRWSNDFRDFMALMLVQEAEKRATADFLLKHPFLNKAARKDEMKKLLSSVFISHKLQQVAVI